MKPAAKELSHVMPRIAAYIATSQVICPCYLWHTEDSRCFRYAKSQRVTQSEGVRSETSCATSAAVYILRAKSTQGVVSEPLEYMVRQ